MVRPSRRRSLVAWLRRVSQVSERRVCGATGFARSSHRYRSGRPAIKRSNDCWAMDFMADSLFDGRTFRILMIGDCHSCESLATVPRQHFPAQQVVEILNGLIQTRGKPHAIRCDNITKIKSANN